MTRTWRVVLGFPGSPHGGFNADLRLLISMALIVSVGGAAVSRGLIKLKIQRGELPARTSRMIEAQTSLHPGVVLEVEVYQTQTWSDLDRRRIHVPSTRGRSVRLMHGSDGRSVGTVVFPDHDAGRKPMMQQEHLPPPCVEDAMFLTVCTASVST